MHKEKFFSCALPVPGACAQGPVVHCNSESTDYSHVLACHVVVAVE